MDAIELEQDDMAYMLRVNGSVVEITRQEHDAICRAGDSRYRGEVVALILRDRFWRIK